ncbi:MAG: MAPEG family protein [Paracoccaceae bacterium]|nr:MAPEG family protein [Paracoccaceae bacterium]
MMPPTLTATYAAVLAIFYVAMSAYVIATRVRTHVNLGDGGNPQMLLAIRRHGNMAEYVPFALLLMALAEILGAGTIWLHATGILLIAGRFLHPFGLTLAEGTPASRVIGTLATFAAIIAPAAAIFVNSLA